MKLSLGQCSQKDKGKGNICVQFDQNARANLKLKNLEHFR